MLEEWTCQVPHGVGIDLVNIATLRELDQRMGGVFVRRTFTPREQAEAASASDPWSYYAGRFAAKEAVFKATAQLLSEKTFDFRAVETLNGESGKPQVVLSSELATIFLGGGITSVQLSLSFTEDYALALAQAVAPD